MRLEHLHLLACPDCQGPLSLLREERRQGDHVLDGALACTRCKAEYPIRGGVPRFVPLDNYATGFGLQWNRHART
jgi:uncharacterized protein YbaR (Trm112 family)